MSSVLKPAGLAEAPLTQKMLRRAASSGRPFFERPQIATADHAAAQAVPAPINGSVAAPDTPAAAPADTDLMARLLHLATGSANPEPLARAVVLRFGSFAAALTAPPRDLYAVAGLNTHGVAAIKLVSEAARRLLRARLETRPVLSDPDKLRAYLASVMSREKIEQFRILFLDGAGALIADEEQARGTVNHTPVYPREVARRALELSAASVILVHNHPSGDPTPSSADLDMTQQISDALRTFNIAIQDHIIVGNGRNFGFRETGFLEP